MRVYAVNPPDYHHSDTWADPAKQLVPAAVRGGVDFKILSDSVYQYTYQTLKTLNDEGLMPEMVQIGNEINPGMLLPLGGYATNGWPKLGELINSGIKAVRDVSKLSDIKPLVILHIAQPENVEFWFSNIIRSGNVSDFDILGFSYYSKWSAVPIGDISRYVADFKKAFNKEVMIVETAYPWTVENADNYGNAFGAGDAAPGYPITPEGQLKYMVDLTKPSWMVAAWASWLGARLDRYAAPDPWGIGSSWDNCTFFDFNGNVNQGMGFMQHKY